MQREVSSNVTLDFQSGSMAQVPAKYPRGATRADAPADRVNCLTAMRVLYLSTKMCWPTISGATLRDFHLARQLARHATRTFVGLDREMGGPVGSCRDECLEPLYNSDVLHVKRHPGYRRTDLMRGLLGPTPISVLNFTSPAIMAQVERVLHERRFDVIQVEGVHLLEYARRIRQLAPDVPLICDWHNIESEVQDRGISGAPDRTCRAT